jgi:hypothetical protein
MIEGSIIRHIFGTSYTTPFLPHVTLHFTWGPRLGSQLHSNNYRAEVLYVVFLLIVNVEHNSMSCQLRQQSSREIFYNQDMSLKK